MPSRALRLWLIGALVVFNVLVLVLSAHSVLQSRRQHELEAETLTQNVAIALDQTLTNSIGKIEFALRVVADELERELGHGIIDAPRMNEMLDRHAGRLPELDAFRVADADGVVILGRGGSDGVRASWADRDYFARHREQADDAIQVSKPIVGRVAQKYIVAFTLRYNYPDGRFAGVIATFIAVDHFAQVMSRYDLGPHGSLILRDAELGLIARQPSIPDTPAGQIGNRGVSPEMMQLYDQGAGVKTYYTPVGADGYARIATLRRMESVPMVVVAATASDDYLASWRVETWIIVSMASGFALLSALLGGGLLRQIGDAERSSRALAERKSQLQTLIEVVPDSIRFKDANGRWLMANSVCLKSFGLEGDDWQGHTDAELLARHPALADRLAEVRAYEDAAWSAGGPLRTEEHGADADGQPTWHEVIRVPLFDDAQQRRAMVEVGRDISERKRGEIELEQHRRKLEDLVAQRTAELIDTEARAMHIVQSSAAGLFGVDTQGIITFVNPAACSMLGYPAGKLIGTSGHELFHHSRPDGSSYPLKECPSHSALVSGRKLRVDDEVYWHADGHAIPVMYEVHPIVQRGNITGAVISFVDMSAQYAAARAGERALAAVEQLARMRSEFLANMSHELRTPLNGVLGFAEIGLRNHRNSDKAREAFEKIQTSGIRLLGVIEDVLDFSKIEAGKMVMEQTSVDLREVIEQAVDLVQVLARAKGLELRVERAADLPDTCLGDPMRIGQVLFNLLSNAVKYTERGSVQLSASLIDGKLSFVVTDTGIGMTASQLDQLFNPFQQGDGSTTRRFGGSGLGLAICKRMAELMRGHIEVRSAPDVGTTAEFRLPYLPVIRAPADR
ncbi:MAG: ATP-binding protein [Methyloversatilis sp.]|uniref:ATP-binding protein n=1 Tax=Methyloversatilis sp. TaxID=2569862 RepID=UPI0027372623|nr:ATP-binding protein [Methyloversatilis sp.]MDP3873872.1 ATP-binding protein [Methyloversatilis sp.]